MLSIVLENAYLYRRTGINTTNYKYVQENAVDVFAVFLNLFVC